MKVLIAGATGLIGKELVSQCLDENIQVNFLTTQKSKITSQPNHQGFYWNPAKGEINPEAFKDVSVLINLAGATVSKRWTATYKKEILQSRVTTAQVLYNYLNNNTHFVKKYISASGISVYPSSLSHLYTEDDTIVSSSFLGEVVKVWEAEADAFSALGITVSKVRTGIVLSKNEGALPKIIQPIKMGVGAPLASGQQWQSWIHIKDIAGIYLHLIKNNLEGIFNAVSPDPVTNERMTKCIAKFYQKKIWLPNVPAFVLKLILGEMSALVLESQLVSAEKIVEEGFQFHYVNLETALEDLL